MIYIEDLPSDDHYYLLKWTAQVDKHPNKEEDYGIKLIFSRLCKDREKLSSLKTGKHTFNYFVRPANNVIESLFGLTPMLPLGSIWRKRKMISSKPTIFSSKTINLNLDKCQITNFHLNDKYDNKRIIPKSHWHVLGGNLNKAGRLFGLMSIKSMGKNPTEIILPHYEIMRAFYATSSNLAISFAQGHLLNDEKYYYDRSKSKLDPFGNVHLHLGEKMSHSDAMHLAHYFSCKRFKRIANKFRSKMVFGDVLNSNVIYSEKSIDIEFPVSGYCKFGLNGLNLPQIGNLKRFLAINITLLNYELPFVELSTSKEGEKEIKHQQKVGTPEPGYKPRPRKTTTDNKDTETQVGSDADADSGYSTKSKVSSLAVHECMKKVSHRKIRKETQEVETYKTNDRPPKKSTKRTTTGEAADRDNDLGKLDINPEEYFEEREANSDKFYMLSKAIKDVCYRLGKEFNVSPIEGQVFNESSGSDKHKNFFAPKKKNSYRWLYVTFKPKKRRMFYIHQVSIAGKNIYFMEIETFMEENGTFKESFPCFVFFKKNTQAIDQLDWWEIIRAMTKYKRSISKSKNSWWGRPDTTPSISKSTFNHSLHNYIHNADGKRIKVRKPIQTSINILSNKIEPIIIQTLKLKKEKLD